MTHKFILKVKKFQLSSVKHFVTVDENLQGVDSTLISFRVNRLGGGGGGEIIFWITPKRVEIFQRNVSYFLSIT